MVATVWWVPEPRWQRTVLVVTMLAQLHLHAGRMSRAPRSHRPWIWLVLGWCWCTMLWLVPPDHTVGRRRLPTWLALALLPPLVAIFAHHFWEQAVVEGSTDPWFDAHIDVPILVALTVVLLPNGWWRDVWLFPLTVHLGYHAWEFWRRPVVRPSP